MKIFKENVELLERSKIKKIKINKIIDSNIEQSFFYRYYSKINIENIKANLISLSFYLICFFITLLCLRSIENINLLYRTIDTYSVDVIISTKASFLLFISMVVILVCDYFFISKIKTIKNKKKGNLSDLDLQHSLAILGLIICFTSFLPVVSAFFLISFVCFFILFLCCFVSIFLYYYLYKIFLYKENDKNILFQEEKKLKDISTKIIKNEHSLIIDKSFISQLIISKKEGRLLFNEMEYYNDILNKYHKRELSNINIEDLILQHNEENLSEITNE